MTSRNENERWSLLYTIDSPQDLRKLSATQLEQLAEELRLFILDSVAKTGGHLAASLGVVELTVALHYVMNTPDDNLVWDVGHQTYPHKILTGRRDRMPTLRQRGGLAGFPKRSESEYDDFGTGHSSTSISAALGMALASKLKGARNKTVAVIGDGAMTAGMAFEALNHAGVSDSDLLVILNDNDMSISPNVGGLSNHLTRLLTGDVASGLRESGKRLLHNLPGPLHDLAKRTEEHVKGMIAPGTMFEELGMQYFGPIDGHDLETLVPTLRNLLQLPGPRMLHVVTQKGKGYFPAENEPVTYHGVGKFEPSTGITPSSNKKASYTSVFSDWLCDMAAEDDRLVGITPAMREGSGLVEFSERFADRYHDVGIAEQHAVTLAAGMACEGIKPVVAIYSTFLQRAYDQLIHDVAVQNLPVMFAIDRAGIVGADGPTHTGAYDISYLRCIPNMLIMAPSDAQTTRDMLTTAFLHDGPSAVRYPRGSIHGDAPDTRLQAIPYGKAVMKREGHKVALLAFGTCLHDAMQAAEELDATVVDMRFIKPLDTAMIDSLCQEHSILFTVEDNAIAGGAGSAVAEYLTTQSIKIPCHHLGYPDRFIDYGDPIELRSEWDLDADGLRTHITDVLKQELLI